MKSMVYVLLRPLATRIGALAASAVTGAIVVDPALAQRVDAWAVAGVLLAADLVIAALQHKTKEVR